MSWRTWKEANIAYLDARDERLDGVHLTIGDRVVESFASCSYMGLEFDARLRQGAIDALDRFGSQFSYSRAYVSSPPFEELESLMGELFSHPVQIAQTTSMVHMAVLPVVVSLSDAVILDSQVHNSVAVAAAVVRDGGTTTCTVPHNDLDALEAKIKELAPTHRRVYYLADGIYSMFGDPAPFDGLATLMNRYPSLFVYIDDAHGMSWRGKHGRGYALDALPMRDQIVFTTSLSKAFAGVGGVALIPDPVLRRKVRVKGGPMVFAIPHPPPMLGIAIASAKIHLSSEIGDRQAKLASLIAKANDVIRSRGLPVVGPFDVPVKFLAVGAAPVVEAISKRMLDKGYFLSATSFPAVPLNRAGLRFTVTAHMVPEQVERMLNTLADVLEEELARANCSTAEVRELFGAPLFANGDR